jgi:exopolyphosphatase/guanosine-5'-triphosphate,3'-diphosphate pyrophosphatase
VKRAEAIRKVVALGESSRFELRHAARVRHLALRLFDELQPLHRMGNTERLWLEAAALLHDVGKRESPKTHHKAARDLIVNSPELPFRWEERVIIALVARYHRGSFPRDGHRYFRDLDSDAQGYVRRLAALLRLADGLDKGRSGLVEDLECGVQWQNVHIRADSRDRVPVRKARAKADLFEAVFARKAVFHVGSQPQFGDATLDPYADLAYAGDE